MPTSFYTSMKNTVYYPVSIQGFCGAHLRSGFFIGDVKKVVDLCAAPGSWSQVLAKRLQ